MPPKTENRKPTNSLPGDVQTEEEKIYKRYISATNMPPVDVDQTKYPQPTNSLRVEEKKELEWIRQEKKQRWQERFDCSYQNYEEEKHKLCADGLRIREELFRQDRRELAKRKAKPSAGERLLSRVQSSSGSGRFFFSSPKTDRMGYLDWRRLKYNKGVTTPTANPLFDRNKCNIISQGKGTTEDVHWELPADMERLHPNDFQGYRSPKEDEKWVSKIKESIVDRNWRLAPIYQHRFQICVKELKDQGREDLLELAPRDSRFVPFMIKGAPDVFTHMVQGIQKERHVDFQLNSRKPDENPLIPGDVTHEGSVYILDKNDNPVHVMPQNCGSWMDLGITFQEARENEVLAQAIAKEHEALEHFWPAKENENTQNKKGDKRFPNGIFRQLEKSHFAGSKFGFGTRHTRFGSENGHSLDQKNFVGGPWSLCLTKTTAGRGNDTTENIHWLRALAVRKYLDAMVYHQVILGLLYRAVDRQRFQDDRDFVEDLVARELLVDHSPLICHHFQAQQSNRSCGCHKDNGDHPHTMVGTTPYGDYVGAHTALVDINLHVRTRFYIGDYAVTKATQTGHCVTPVLAGERASLVDTSKSGLATARHNHRYLPEPEKTEFMENWAREIAAEDAKWARIHAQELQLAIPFLKQHGKDLHTLEHGGSNKDKGDFYKITMLALRKKHGTQRKYLKAATLKKQKIKKARSEENPSESVEELEAKPTGLFYKYDDFEEKRIPKDKIPFKKSDQKTKTFEDLSQKLCPV